MRGRPRRSFGRTLQVKHRAFVLPSLDGMVRQLL